MMSSQWRHPVRYFYPKDRRAVLRHSGSLRRHLAGAKRLAEKHPFLAVEPGHHELLDREAIARRRVERDARQEVGNAHANEVGRLIQEVLFTHSGIAAKVQPRQVPGILL